MVFFYVGERNCSYVIVSRQRYLFDTYKCEALAFWFQPKFSKLKLDIN